VGEEARQLLQARRSRLRQSAEWFKATDADDILYIACADLGRLRGGKPVEADAFELWFYAMRELLSPMGLADIEELRGITEVPRLAQIEMGRKFLAAARAR
jgi:hypothetical protein